MSDLDFLLQNDFITHLLDFQTNQDIVLNQVIEEQNQLLEQIQRMIKMCEEQQEQNPLVQQLQQIIQRIQQIQKRADGLYNKATQMSQKIQASGLSAEMRNINSAQQPEKPNELLDF
ncbi:Hypothetical_protein [Hexamita inflata]|uniref:Hypothetical_protein n=1 Tax=Hexamita inflata TaxID=28002 RepID=A0AA86PX44_9EUKA|nr:Hypothetical protein HINF_LOCUS26083 [Hexamita inflata]CAI9947656.1 Hypothetical protein HINF_LOCUS35301 [Hexamita inflata]